MPLMLAFVNEERIVGNIQVVLSCKGQKITDPIFSFNIKGDDIKMG